MRLPSLMFICAGLSAAGLGCGDHAPAAQHATGKKPPPVETHAHQAAVTAAVQPLIDAEWASGVVIGLYDAGRVEVYGFGKGPGNHPPDGATLFEIGSVTKVFTSLLLADAVQRQEVSMNTELADLLPPGVTVPTRDHRTITLGQLALHTSGLPKIPPSLAGKTDGPDPYAKYTEDQLYADLIQSPLRATPGTHVAYSNFGAGVLGFALSRKLGMAFDRAVETRVLIPLGLASTYFTVPAGAKVRRMTGTSSDLVPVPYWYFGTLAGAGALISDAHDMLELISDELDASSGSLLPLRDAMRFSQEQQLDHALGESAGLGWQIDSAGRFWHAGQTGGFHSFVGFDPKTRRGVVILASTALQLLDRLGDDMYRVLASDPANPVKLPTLAQVKDFTGTYSLQGEPLVVAMKGTRLYVSGRGTPPYRMVPISEREVWIEPLQAIVAFQPDPQTGKLARAIFFVNDQQLPATRTSDDAPPPAFPAPPPPAVEVPAGSGAAPAPAPAGK